MIYLTVRILKGKGHVENVGVDDRITQKIDLREIGECCIKLEK